MQAGCTSCSAIKPKLSQQLKWKKWTITVPTNGRVVVRGKVFPRQNITKSYRYLKESSELRIYLPRRVHRVIYQQHFILTCQETIRLSFPARIQQLLEVKRL